MLASISPILARLHRIAIGLCAIVLAGGALADDSWRDAGPGNVVGTWLATVTFPPASPVSPFKESWA